MSRVRNLYYGVTTPAYWRDLVWCYFCNRKRPWWWPWMKFEVVGSYGEPQEPAPVCRNRCIGDPGSLSDLWRRFLWAAFKVDR